MKLWIDDVRPAPEGYMWIKSVNEAVFAIKIYGKWSGNNLIELIDIDHDAGVYANFGGDYIKLLDWMEEFNMCNFPIHIHSMNPVGVANMHTIIQRNGWKEI